MKPHYAPDFPTVHVVEYAPRRLYDLERITDVLQNRMKAIIAADAQRALEDTQRDGNTAGGAADGLLTWAVSHAANGSRHSMALWLAGRLKAEGLARWAAQSVLEDFAQQVSTAGTRQLDTDEMQNVVGYVWGCA